MTTLTVDRSKLRRRTLTRNEISNEIGALTRRFGTLDELSDKDSRDALTADERAAMRRLDGLHFLLHGK